MAGNQFHIREICQNPRDGDFIVAAFDGALPHLASIGSGGQWGSVPFSQQADRKKQAYDSVPASEAFRRGEAGAVPKRLYIAEVALDGNDNAYRDVDVAGLSVRLAADDERGEEQQQESGKRFLSVAAATVKEHYWPEYMKEMEDMKPIIDKADAEGDVFYLEFLISDFRTGSARKGAGAALVKKIKEYSISRGAKLLYVDCWSGNGGNLVKFYTSQGFTVAANFVGKRWQKDDWHGTLLRMELD